MKRNWLVFLLILCLCTFMVCPVMAEDSLRLMDSEGLLTDGENVEILAQLDEISERHDFDVVILTIDSLQGWEAIEAAYHLYDSLGYRENGIVLLLSMEDRDWAIAPCGTGESIFSGYDVEYIADEILDALHRNDFAKAFSQFAFLCDEYLTRGGSGWEDEYEDPYSDSYYPYEDPYSSERTSQDGSGGLAAVISLIVGAVSALIGTGVMKKKLKSVYSAAAAADYVRSGSMNITQANELFLYRQVSRIPRNTESSGGRSGGFSGGHSGGSARSGKF